MRTLTPSSSRIVTIEYDEDTLVMRIFFKRGGAYEYYEVPPDVYWALANAESVGKAFDTHIKNAGFDYKKF